MRRKSGGGSTRLLVGMALSSGITSVPNAAIVLALPTIHRTFNVSLTELEWTITGYLLAYSALLIAAGRLADEFGRVRVLTFGTVLYMAASVPAAPGRQCHRADPQSDRRRGRRRGAHARLTGDRHRGLQR